MNEIFDHLHHVCIVVHDIDRTQAYYESIGIGPWQAYPPLADYVELDVPNREGFLAMQYRVCFLPSVQLQLCQPNDDPSPQRIFLDTKGEGVFHLGFEVPDADTARAVATASGLEHLMHGRRANGTGFDYYDTEPDAGRRVADPVHPTRPDVSAVDEWIGRAHTSSAVLDPVQANRMAVTLDREPDFDDGDAVPLGWHWLYFHDLVRASRLGPDGHPALGETMPPVSLPRRMWAGGDIRFVAPLRLGATATRTSTVTDVVEKQGRTGPLCFVTVVHDVRVDDELTLIETQDIVYREMPAGAAPIEGPPAPGDPHFSGSWHLDSTALFRYSALTFNGHRIHYDADHARSVERYPNLVIHGPLIATLLLDLASREQVPVRSFRYRARSPLFLPEAFVVSGRRESGATSLWAATTDGRLAMSAEAFDS